MRGPHPYSLLGHCRVRAMRCLLDSGDGGKPEGLVFVEGPTYKIRVVTGPRGLSKPDASG